MGEGLAGGGRREVDSQIWWEVGDRPHKQVGDGKLAPKSGGRCEVGPQAGGRWKLRPLSHPFLYLMLKDSIPRL